MSKTESKNKEDTGKTPSKSENVGRFQDATLGFIEGLGKRMWAYADAHPYATLYSAVGFVLAVLILVVGFWRTVVIALFVGIGAALGQEKDGEGGIHDFFHRIFSTKR